jgi:hypothetical protein
MMALAREATNLETIWLDESARTSAQGIVYVVAAVRSGAPSGQSRLTSVLRPAQRYLHWRDESSEMRQVIVGALNEIGLDAYVATALSVRPKGQEAARSACLAAVVREASLDSCGLDSVVIEGRGDVLNRHDEYTVRNEGRSVQPGLPLQLTFASKSAWPLLWAADSISSMASAHFSGAGRSDHWWRSLRADRLTIRHIRA